jgi:hypothetical protein
MKKKYHVEIFWRIFMSTVHFATKLTMNGLSEVLRGPSEYTIECSVRSKPDHVTAARRLPQKRGIYDQAFHGSPI